MNPAGVATSESESTTTRVDLFTSAGFAAIVIWFESNVFVTGTGVVPPDGFTLQAGDVVEIEIPGLGVLKNPVTVV